MPKLVSKLTNIAVINCKILTIVSTFLVGTLFGNRHYVEAMRTEHLPNCISERGDGDGDGDGDGETLRQERKSNYLSMAWFESSSWQSRHEKTLSQHGAMI